MPGWKGYSVGNMRYHQPVTFDGGNVYVGGGRGIAVFDLETGGKEQLKAVPAFGRWYKGSLPTWWPRVYKPLRVLSGPEGFVMTAPAIANGFIFAGSDDGSVYAWDLKTEKVVWKYETGGKVRSSPAISRGRLFVGSDDGHVYCFGNE